MSAKRAGKDGRIFWVEVKLKGVMDGQNGIAIQGAVRDITTNKIVEARLLSETYQDPVTNLVNRVMFLDLLDKAIARARLVPGVFPLPWSPYP